MKKIIIVDDEEKIRRIYSELFTSDGYQVFEAANAIDANDILKREGADLILLDINMPEVDGSQLYQIVESFHKKSKVIVCSVRPVEEQREIIKGAMDYYDKSQGIDVLHVKVKTAFDEIDGNSNSVY